MAEACAIHCPLLNDALKRTRELKQLLSESDDDQKYYAKRAEQFEEFVEVILSKCIDCPGINVESYEPPKSQCQAPGIADHLPSMAPGSRIFLSRLIR